MKKDVMVAIIAVFLLSVPVKRAISDFFVACPSGNTLPIIALEGSTTFSGIFEGTINGKPILFEYCNKFDKAGFLVKDSALLSDDLDHIIEIGLNAIRSVITRSELASPETINYKLFAEGEILAVIVESRDGAVLEGKFRGTIESIPVEIKEWHGKPLEFSTNANESIVVNNNQLTFKEIQAIEKALDEISAIFKGAVK